MGYYYQKARSVKDLNEAQQARYEELRSPENNEHHSELLRRYNEVKEYIGPIFNGETWSALEELIQDSVVTWILADEDPAKVEWSNPKDLLVPEPEPTEEERQRRREAWDEIVRGWEQREEREKQGARESKEYWGTKVYKLEDFRNFRGLVKVDLIVSLFIIGNTLNFFRRLRCRFRKNN